MLNSGIQPSRSTVPVQELLRARYADGRISLPVSGSAVYARFRHVQGVPTDGETMGFSLSRLRVLDTLIDRLVRMQGNDDFQRHDEGMSPEAVDALIDRYKQELSSTLTRLEAAGYTNGLVESGMSVSLLV
ncbi:MAG: hypothetical protein EA428_01325 [Spirochaetaceae bacterium]|nr:MAG: hypothetical protein EA428_01325 [Spirochaetaceae bacterium]